MTWQSHLTPQEAKRLNQIDQTKRALYAERRILYDRAKKRKQRA